MYEVKSLALMGSSVQDLSARGRGLCACMCSLNSRGGSIFRGVEGIGKTARRNRFGRLLEAACIIGHAYSFPIVSSRTSHWKPEISPSAGIYTTGTSKHHGRRLFSLRAGC